MCAEALVFDCHCLEVLMLEGRDQPPRSAFSGSCYDISGTNIHMGVRYIIGDEYYIIILGIDNHRDVKFMR